MDIISTNPSTKEIIGKITASTTEEMHARVQTARAALPQWKALGVDGRVEALGRVVKELSKRQEELAHLTSNEMGMPITQSRLDVSGAIEYFSWYLDNAREYLTPEVTFEDEEVIHEVHYEPTGVVAAITPWNFPASNFVWMVGQNLIVGNTVVFKHSEEVPLCGTLIEEILATAKLPEGVFSEVYGDGRVGDVLVHENIDMICFTGSSATGQYLYTVAAEKFVRAFFELGGSAPGIVCEDTDVAEVVDTIYANRFDNCGQICDGLKRLIVHKSKVDEVMAALQRTLERAVIGDASDEKTTIGPLVSEKQLHALEAQVDDAKKKGAAIQYQKKLPNHLHGWFYPPTILTDITPDMAVWREEVFGPVLPIVTFDTEEEAIRLANDTKYGLGGYVFTTDKDRFSRIASLIQTGMVQMNNVGYVRPPTPFGGCKLSGFGREHGKYGFHELATIKSVTREK